MLQPETSQQLQQILEQGQVLNPRTVVRDYTVLLAGVFGLGWKYRWFLGEYIHNGALSLLNRVLILLPPLMFSLGSRIGKVVYLGHTVPSLITGLD